MCKRRNEERRRQRKGKGRQRRRRGQSAAGILALLLAAGIFSMYVARVVMAAPENPDVEKLADEAGLGNTAEERLGELGAGSVSGNEIAKEETADTGRQGTTGAGAVLKSALTRVAPLIVVDPGHGGMDEGCAVAGALEKDVNLAIARLVQEKLREAGFLVLMTRTDDVYMAKEERARLANLCGADAYISIHQNSCEDTGVTGMETWYDGTDVSRDSKRLAKLVHKYTLKSTGAQERELRDDAQLCVTGQTRMPACLIETGFLTNPAECAQLITAEYQEKLAQGIVDGITLFFRPKTMYLTFDDGPSAQNTCTVLDILKEHDIKVTFFVIGESVKKHPEVARRIVAEGHTIGIHCNNHDYNKIYASAESYLEDFETARQTVLDVTGVEAKLFRFPGGSINVYNGDVREEIVEKMTENGYIYFDWNASLEDAVKKSTPQKLIENATSSTLGRKKVVMLAHDVVDNTALCLEELLEQFPEYQMRPLTERIAPVQFAKKG